MNKFFTWYTLSRTIHRIFVSVVIIGTIIMGGTGSMLKYPALNTLLNLDLGMIRAVHNAVSSYFGGILAIMAITGSIMYIYPWYMRKKQQRS